MQAMGEYVGRSFFGNVQRFVDDIVRFAANHQQELVVSLIGLVLAVWFFRKRR